MPSSRKRRRVSVGEPPQTLLKDVETVEFTIYDFEDRKETQGKQIKSPILFAHGYEWRIIVNPRGSCFSMTDHEYISCGLRLRTEYDVTVGVDFRCKEFKEGDCFHVTPALSSSKEYTTWGVREFLKRENVLQNYLEDDGSLVIKVNIQVAVKNKRVWYPKKLQQQEFLVELYQDASSETSDVGFSIGETVYRAHKTILSLRGKKLYEIANKCDSDNNDRPIPILSMREEIFKSILEFIYTVKTPEIENEGIATELLVAADRYEVVHLKLYVESIIVDKFLTAGTAASLLIFADSHSCALLKEAATNVFVTNPTTVKKSEAWSKVRESRRLLDELLDSLVCSIEPVGDTPNPTSDIDQMDLAALRERDQMNAIALRESEIDQMDVTALREELQEANLELDGSREVLVDRLKTHHNDQQVTEN